MFQGILKFLNDLFEKPFKVGIISYYYPYRKPSTSGVGTHVYNLVTNLAKLGCEVHVFTFTDKKEEEEKIKLKSGTIVLHHLNADFRYEVSDSVIAKRVKYTIFEKKVLDAVSVENSRRKFDVLHTHGWLTSSAFILKYLYNIPWVHTVHALERNRLPSMTDEEKKLFRLTSWIEETIVDSDKLISVSQSASKEIVKAFPKTRKKIDVLPNGVNLELFIPADKEPKTILTVSRFSKEKGVEFIPEVARTVLETIKDSKFKVIIAKTEIPTLKHIQDKFIELQNEYPSRFNWISNPIEATELAKHYRSSEIYLQTSFYETFGLCILEGMSSGNAIVSTNVGGVPEVVGNAGILVKPDQKEISSALIRLLKSEKLRKEYSRRAIERAKLFDWKNIAEKTLSLYKEVIERKKKVFSEGKSR